MATKPTDQEFAVLRTRAAGLRAAGRSRRAIQTELRIGPDLAKLLLRGVPVPPSLRRPNAKDGVREVAVAMRLDGKSYVEIADRLGVSKSTCSLWLRSLPRPAVDQERAGKAQEARLRGLRDRGLRDRIERDAQGDTLSADVAEGLGEVTARDLMVTFAVSYWCEGAKRKPWNRQERMVWMNSDPMLVRLFLEGLRILDVDADRLRLSVHIHASANERAARLFWSGVTGIDASRFQPSTIKRHNPTTRRKNVGAGYHGCLSIRVLQGRALYRVVQGMLDGLAHQPRAAARWQDDHEPQAATAHRSALV